MVVNDLFGQLLEVEPLFANKEVMRSSYTPDDLPHRDLEIRSLGSILVPALRGETPSNVFIYGKTGTGKTACVKYVGKELSAKGEELGKRVNLIYINCEVVDTQYRVLQNIANAFVPADKWSHRIPFTGWPTDEVYDALRRYVDGNTKGDDERWTVDTTRKPGEVTIIVLDEVDKLKGDEVLYTLTRINSDLANNKVSVIGISNDLKFTEFLDPRVKSSLGEESMIFAPYDATQLEDILTQRAKMALKDGVLDDSVIPLCSALAAREHGDARRALDLLRVAAEGARGAPTRQSGLIQIPLRRHQPLLRQGRHHLVLVTSLQISEELVVTFGDIRRELDEVPVSFCCHLLMGESEALRELR